MIAPLRIDIQRVPDLGAHTLDAKRTLRHAQSAASQQLAETALRTRDLPLDALERRDECWIVHATPPLWLSISHAGPWVVCAHDIHHPCAVDIERTRRAFDWRYAVEHFLHPQLKSTLERCHESQKHEVFTVLWTILEAQGKLLGWDLNAAVAAPIFHDQKLRVTDERFADHRAIARWLDTDHLCTVLCHLEHIPSLIHDGWQRIQHEEDVMLLSDSTMSWQANPAHAQE